VSLFRMDVKCFFCESCTVQCLIHLLTGVRVDVHFLCLWTGFGFAMWQRSFGLCSLHPLHLVVCLLCLTIFRTPARHDRSALARRLSLVSALHMLCTHHCFLIHGVCKHQDSVACCSINNASSLIHRSVHAKLAILMNVTN
jgi:hypothetical protein